MMFPPLDCAFAGAGAALAEWRAERVRNVTLFDAVPAEQMRQAQIVTGFAMAAFIGAGVVPGLRPYAATIRLVLLVVYLVACGAFVAWALLR
jgi:hypothetical protein